MQNTASDISSVDRGVKSVLYSLLLLLLGSVVFSASFPNDYVRFGWGWLISFSLVPVGLLLRRIRFASTFVYGFLYGLITYVLFNLWLGKFSPVAFLIVPPIYGGYFALVFPVLKIVELRAGKYTFILQAMIWLFYEYLRSSGFLGYSFGTLGYAWSFYPVLIQSATVLGVWGVTFFIALSSFFIAQCINDITTTRKSGIASKESFLYRMVRWGNEAKTLIWNTHCYRYFVLVYLCVGALGLVYGVLAKSNYDERNERAYSTGDTVRIALMQHATDPWKGGLTAYKVSLERLIELTEEVMASENVPEIVVWSETAFVPSISYHLKYREHAPYTRLIQELISYLEKYPDTKFIIGNGEGVKLPNKDGVLERQNYNAALFFRGGERIEAYYKLHLVPFTEYFPYAQRLPRFYKFLQNYDVHFWLPGEEYTVFDMGRAKISTPICFEDGFGAQNAKYIREGANFLVNITNDAWSGIETNAMQHLQASIFRAVENRRSLVRSTNSGMTASISPSGEILEMLPSFETDSLVVDAWINDGAFTLYTRMEDWFVGLVVLIFLVILVRYLFVKFMNKNAHR